VQIADNLPLEREPAASLAEIRRTAEREGVKIEVGARGIAAAHLRRMIDVCGELGSELLRVVVDTTGCWSAEQVIREVQDTAPHLERTGVTLAIENHDRISARDLARIVESAGSARVGVCLDTVNSFGCLEGPDHVVTHLAPHVMNLHVKDFTVRRAPHMMGFEIAGTPAGQGMLDLPWLLSRLRSAGRDPNAILELWPAPEHDIAGTVAKEAEWARESIRYLRTLIPD
jgi:sugar phosphate isomerase/epimerase